MISVRLVAGEFPGIGLPEAVLNVALLPRLKVEIGIDRLADDGFRIPIATLCDCFNCLFLFAIEKDCYWLFGHSEKPRLDCIELRDPYSCPCVI